MAQFTMATKLMEYLNMGFQGDAVAVVKATYDERLDEISLG